jgi:hypothetical protein
MVPEVKIIVNGKEDLTCQKHRRDLNEEIARVKPDILIASSWNAASVIGGDSELTSGMTKQYAFLKQHATRFVVIGETPVLPDPRACFKSNTIIRNCIGKATTSAKYRQLTEKIATRVQASYLDISEWMCILGSCPPVIDNNFVTWDGGHLTKAFSSKLSPLFLDYLIESGALN